MKRFLLLLTLACVWTAFPQIPHRPVAWSGVLTDEAGNPLEEANVQLKFTYYEAGNVILYSEVQSKTTDSKGFVSANIGQGTVIQTGSSLRFMSPTLSLKVEADTGQGFVELSSDYLRAVPFSQAAMYAGTLTDNHSSIGFPTNQDVEVNANTRLKIYTNQAQVAEFDEEGLTLDNLAGSQQRAVVATTSGQLIRKPAVIREFSLSGANFISSNDRFSFNAINGLFSTATAPAMANLFAPVFLPDGAQVTQMTGILKMNVAGAHLSVFLCRQQKNTTSTSLEYVASLSSLDQSASFVSYSTTPTAGNGVINNNSYVYFVVIQPGGSGWTGSSNLCFKYLTIKYLEP